jgi:hypothetical protein
MLDKWQHKSKEKQRPKNQKVILVFKELQDLMVRQVRERQVLMLWQVQKVMQELLGSQRDSKCKMTVQLDSRIERDQGIQGTRR